MARSMMGVAGGERLVGAGEVTLLDADWGLDQWDDFLVADPAAGGTASQESRRTVGRSAVAPPARRPAGPRRSSLARPADGRPAPARPVGSRPRPAGKVRRSAGRPSGGRTSRQQAVAGACRLRLTPRGRLTILVVLAVIGFAAFGLGRASADGSGAPIGPATVVVQPGDTLWDIASAAMPKSDPRDAVDALKALNHLDSAAVQVGQSLLLR